MGLSTDLISQFVKVTNDNTKKNKESTTAYGTVKVDSGNQKYVQLDGSEVSTPVTMAVSAKDGDRVIVTIKNHTATVTGNISDPSASSETVSGLTDNTDKITELEVAVAKRITTETFNAAKADIEQLQADKVVIQKSLEASQADISNLKAGTVTISEKLDANEASIKDLEANKLSVEAAEATYATIENLNATNATIHNLETTYGNFVDLTTDELKAINASIKKLDAEKLSAADAEITYATIAELTAAKGSISILESDVSDINTLIFGSATGDVIQTSFANAVVAQLGNAQIKSAMIDSLSADKITAGDINTKNVRITSPDGNLLLSDETMQISDGTRVRVQIGKDADDDYSINIWDADGNLMFSEGGITDSAIKKAIIRDDMVSDTANISAHKLDIDSLFEEINGSSKTIKSTRVYLDEKGQTLDVAFKKMTDDVGSQGTAISVLQGQISSKVWKQDITAAVDDINVGGRNYFIRKNINNLAWGSGNNLLENPAYRGYSFPVTEGEEWILYRTDTTNNRWGLYWLDTEPIAGLVTLQTAMRDDDQVAGRINRFTVPSGVTWAFIYLSNAGDEIPNIMLEKGNKATDWSPAPEDVEGDITTLSTQYSNLEQTVDSISATVASHTTALEKKADNSKVTEVSDKVTEVQADLDGFRTSVSETYAKKSDVESLSSSMNSKISQTESSIETLVSKTSTIENKFNDYSTTEEVQSAIDQKADGITASVSSTYATKKSVENVQNDIDGLEIGGRNYFSPSNTVDLGCTGMASGEQSLISTGTCKGFYVPVEEGDVWTLSRGSLSNNRFDYCFTIDEPAAGVLIYGWNSGARELLKIEGIVVPSGSGYKYLFVYLSNQNDVLDNIKLERGNRATDWTPAPEDMATSQEVDTAQTTANEASDAAANAETLVKQLSDSISMLVTDGNGTSLMTQTENGWTFSTANIQSSVNDMSEALDSLTTEVGDVGIAVDILQQAVKDLGEIADYVYITTYEDEPCIELGEGDSEFKLRITNTRMMFTEGSTILAYFTNQAFNSKKIVVEEEFQQGGYVWKVRSNGHLGLTWKGGNS